MIDSSRSNEEILDNVLMVMEQDRGAIKRTILGYLDEHRGVRVYDGDVVVDYVNYKQRSQNELLVELKKKIGALYA